MGEQFSLQTAARDVVDSIVSAVGDLAPRVLTALAVILLGYLVARLVERGLRGLLERVRFDTFLEKIGIRAALKRIGVHGSVSRAVARVVYFLLIVLFVQAATESVGLTTISEAIQAFFGYLPHVVAALVLVLLGSVIAEFASKAVAQSARESGIDYADALGRVVSALIFFVVAIMAVTQLQIETDIVKAVAIVVLSGMSLGLALSFGLGTRDVTRNILAGFYARKLFEAGEEIELKGEIGTLIAITPIQTLIEREGKVVSVPNSVFLEEVVRQ